MSKLLAIDWDHSEARYVLASVVGSKVTILEATAVALSNAAEEGVAEEGVAEEDSEPDVGLALRRALGGKRVRGINTLLGVDRQSIELAHFTLPPATDDELPELVRNQALRESQTVTEDSPLDFLVLDDDPSEPRKVIAAGLAPDQLAGLRRTCVAAGIRPNRMPLRPYASASLLRRLGLATEKTCLLVNRINHEVDLSVLVAGRAVFSRTVRVPEDQDEEQTSDRILVEINRTLAVALQDQLGAGTIESVVLFGATEEHDPLAERIRQATALPVDILDPFEMVEIADNLLPERTGRFASLVGMLLDEAAGDAHAIDFLHTKQTPKAPSRRRTVVLAAGLLAVVAVVYYQSEQKKIEELDAQVVELQEELGELVREYRGNATYASVVRSVGAWDTRRINWLDELRDIAVRLPPERDIVLSRMSLAETSGGAGSISFYGRARQPEVVLDLERAFRFASDGYRVGNYHPRDLDRHDLLHTIRTQRLAERQTGGEYTWTFEAKLSVKPRSPNLYLPAAPTPTAPAPTGAASSASFEESTP